MNTDKGKKSIKNISKYNISKSQFIKEFDNT